LDQGAGCSLLSLQAQAVLATAWEKTFFFLPLGHSEDFSHLDRAVHLAEELVEPAPPKVQKILEHSASQARGHRDVIARFGRHPHRNAVLGRQSTPEEVEYLARGQFVIPVRCPNSNGLSYGADDQTLATASFGGPVDFDGLNKAAGSISSDSRTGIGSSHWVFASHWAAR
jgi:hypothetical protein